MNYSIYEHGNSVKVPNRNDLEMFLISVREEFDIFRDIDKENNRQNFLSFDGDLARAKNYCGFIHTPDIQIDIWPKLFDSHHPSDKNKSIYIQHILYWLSYCTKWKFPFLKNNLDSTEITDFPEIIINLMATEILRTISEQPIALYEDLQVSLQNPKGRINFSRYLSKGFISGNHHILECDYSPFQFDNALNRIIKFIARVLETRAKHEDTLYKLTEILFILDEVSDVYCSVNDLDRIRLNTHYSDYEPIIETCRIVMNQLFYNSGGYEQPHWCLLLPMELIFEDFITGFIKEKFKEWNPIPQMSKLTLAESPKAFEMYHDIFLKKGDTHIIVDAKYKIRQPVDLNSAKKGVSQSDMYQMISYAYRRGCNNVLMLYPNTGDKVNTHTFNIKSGYEDCDEVIKVTVADVPIWSMTAFSKGELDTNLYSVLDRILSQYAQ